MKRWLPRLLRYAVRVSKHDVTTAIDYPNAAPHMGHEARKANLTVFLSRALLSLNGIASGRLSLPSR